MPPPPRRGPRELGPTPRYSVIPRWGLVERFDAPAEQQALRAGPSAAAVRMTLMVTMAVLGAAAFLGAEELILLDFGRTEIPIRSALRRFGAVLRAMEEDGRDQTSS
jgi:hypothetical protein